MSSSDVCTASSDVCTAIVVVCVQLVVVCVRFPTGVHLLMRQLYCVMAVVLTVS